jgi:acyl carrier protein
MNPMMTPDEIRAAIAMLLARIAPEADTAALAGDVPIRRQIDLDSMDSLNVIAGLTERFGVPVPESDYGRLQTMDDMVAYVAERLAAGRAGG